MNTKNESGQSDVTCDLVFYPPMSTLINLSRPKQHMRETWVEDQFRVLEAAYRIAEDEWIHFSPEAQWAEERLAQRLVLPRYLLRLLPIAGGWVYHPRWYKPECISLLSKRTQKRFAEQGLSATDSEEARQIYYLERKITQRAAVLAHEKVNKHLLDDAIVEAQDHLRAFALLQSPLYPAFENQISLMTQRHEWLKKWQLARPDQRRWLAGTTKVAANHVAGLIRPEDIDEATLLFEELRRPGRENSSLIAPPEICIGQWYVLMLLKCGATHHDLQPGKWYKKRFFYGRRGVAGGRDLFAVWTKILVHRGLKPLNRDATKIGLERSAKERATN